MVAPNHLPPAFLALHSIAPDHGAQVAASTPAVAPSVSPDPDVDRVFYRIAFSFTVIAVHFYHLWRAGVQCGCTHGPTLHLMEGPRVYYRAGC